MSTSLADDDGQSVSLSNISSLLRTRSTSLTNAARRRIGDIRSITGASRILAMNALIEAARAGESGRGFSAVANEVRDIATQIEQLAAGLEGEIGSEVDGLVSVCDQASQAVQNERLVDLACNAIEIIDRNLYERTCDVRWWATDWPIATCAADPTDERVSYAQNRLALILKAYTVYLDLWIVGLDGTVIANGRPDRYTVRGQSVRNEKWFAEAMRLPNGSCFSVADISASPMLAGAQVATYCASIRENGAESGKPTGVLAIHFDWEPQARAIVEGVRLSPMNASARASCSSMRPTGSSRRRTAKASCAIESRSRPRERRAVSTRMRAAPPSPSRSRPVTKPTRAWAGSASSPSSRPNRVLLSSNATSDEARGGRRRGPRE